MAKAKIYFGCAVEGCDKKYRPGRKYCGAHAARLRIHGDLHYSYKSEEEKLRRFWADVDKTPGHGPWGDCWLWTGRLDKDGYGLCKSDERRGTVWKAHRWSYAQANGPIPAELVIRHMCDVRNCANDAHLLSGTSADNTGDMVERGRHLRGEQKPQAKLTDDIVRSLRQRVNAGEKKAHIAKELNVSEAAVSHACLFRTWTHIQ